MAADLNRVRQQVKAFRFKDLFLDELGWDDHDHNLPVVLDENTYTLEAIAHKRGMVAYGCSIPKGQNFPLYQQRRKLETKISRTTREHIIVFTDADQTRQLWQWVRREVGKPTACREYHFHSNQSGEAIAQKLVSIAFSLEEEENLTIADVTLRVQSGLDVEKITKKFYDRFKKEHDAFLKFLQGIPDVDLKRWYASVMLNRLMFIYFIQKKGFLGGDLNYLKTKLALMKKEGKDRFYTHFLCPLFFEGFAVPEGSRGSKVNRLLGKVPYLNGGIFQKHQIEQLHGKTIEVPDKAFEKLFAFFEEYNWHLDERPMRADNEVNPDVLGYIFEKYINQKQMGAYYTKEDITEYISRNTIIPRLFDMAREKCKVAFEGDRSVWDLIPADPDRYIFDAVKKGCDRKLPREIAAGIRDVAQRTQWNLPAAEEFALPTEIWRETVARRQRYEEIRSRLKKGQVRSINDFLTYNLNIRQFAQDVIENCEGPDLLRALWRAIVGRIPEKSNETFRQGISILDPTCGSGAFLFAALNILEPLYEACLDRMQAFIDEAGESRKGSAEKYTDFKSILAEVRQHHNEKYFIYKSIIINNLFGVDIMEEAVEICKLRLFLKLVAQIERSEELEPLPDIDFNIRAGNTLVGFASLQEVKDALKGDLIEQLALPEIEEEAQNVDRAYQRFRQMQTKKDMDSSDFADAKGSLNKSLSQLESRLNGYLAGAYGITEGKKNYKNDLEAWLNSHQPFHWCIEFYGIVNNGGFDVIIGNPPYLELKEIDYNIINFDTKETKAVHAMCIERATVLLKSAGCISMIVPLSIVSTQRMQIIQFLLEKSRDCWYANYSWRPAKMFDTVNRALTIFVGIASVDPQAYSTNYQKWNSDSRDLLLYNLNYVQVPHNRNAFWVPKFGDNIEKHIFEKCISIQHHLSDYLSETNNRVFYRCDGGLYWKVFTDFAPRFVVNGIVGHSTRETCFKLKHKNMIPATIALMSSNLFWWWYTVTSNCRHLNPYDVYSFPVPESAMNDTVITQLD